MHRPRPPLATAAALVRADARPALLPLLTDARSADPRHGPVALAALLALTAPQVGRILAIWSAGSARSAGGPPGDRDVLLAELQLDLAVGLDACPATTEAALRAWISARVMRWLVQHARRAQAAVQGTAQLRASA